MFFVRTKETKTKTPNINIRHSSPQNDIILSQTMKPVEERDPAISILERFLSDLMLAQADTRTPCEFLWTLYVDLGFCRLLYIFTVLLYDNKN